MRSVLLDTNLLVLLVVGSASPEFISRHKRTDGYTLRDFDLLVSLLSQFQQILLTPNTLTEASNLLGQSKDHIREEVMAHFHELIQEATETAAASRVAASEPEFLRLGLTDAALLSLNDASSSILTTDANLYYAALARGQDAHNFHHYREAEGIA